VAKVAGSNPAGPISADFLNEELFVNSEMRVMFALLVCFLVFPAVYAMNLPMEASMSELCDQLKQFKAFDNMTIDVHNFNASQLMQQVGMENLLQYAQGMNLTEEELAMLQNMSEEDLRNMGFPENMEFNPFEDSPILSIASAINKTTTLDVYYNRSNCLEVTMVIEDGELKNIAFGDYGATPLYLKLDLIFVEDVIRIMSESSDREGLSLIGLYFRVGTRVMSAFFDGSLVISPIWGVFDLWRAFNTFMAT
jgi:hypothetical protein